MTKHYHEVGRNRVASGVIQHTAVVASLVSHRFLNEDIQIAVEENSARGAKFV